MTKLFGYTGRATRYQIKGMDIIFPLIPLRFYVGLVSGLNTAASHSRFFKMLKLVKNGATFLSCQTQLLGHFLPNGCHSQTQQDFDMKPKPYEA